MLPERVLLDRQRDLVVEYSFVIVPVSSGIPTQRPVVTGHPLGRDSSPSPTEIRAGRLDLQLKRVLQDALGVVRSPLTLQRDGLSKKLVGLLRRFEATVLALHRDTGEGEGREHSESQHAHGLNHI